MNVKNNKTYTKNRYLVSSTRRTYTVARVNSKYDQINSSVIFTSRHRGTECFSISVPRAGVGSTSFVNIGSAVPVTSVIIRKSITIHLYDNHNDNRNMICCTKWLSY